MAAITARASKIQGQIGVEEDDAVAGVGEEAGVGAFVDVEPVGGSVEVGVDLVVVDEADVAVEVFDGGLVVDASDGATVEGGGEVWVVDRLAAGASLLGALVVRDEMGVRDGSVGRLTERDVLGRFEPPPHDAVRTMTIATSAIE